jgi:hypothetical protein
MELEKELETYRRELPSLLKQEGQFVVISGDEVLGAWPTYSAAMTAGYEKYGLGPFMVKQIQATEYPRILLHDLHPRCRD